MLAGDGPQQNKIIEHFFFSLKEECIRSSFERPGGSARPAPDRRRCS
jgi:hypothetical protein